MPKISGVSESYLELSQTSPMKPFLQKQLTAMNILLPNHFIVSLMEIFLLIPKNWKEKT